MALPGGTARLSVSRTSDRDLKDRQVIVTLDGLPFATLLYGQRAARPISAGSHTLRVNNTVVWKTVAFEAVGGEAAAESEGFFEQCGRGLELAARPGDGADVGEAGGEREAFGREAPAEVERASEPFVGFLEIPFAPGDGTAPVPAVRLAEATGAEGAPGGEGVGSELAGFGIEAAIGKRSDAAGPQLVL